LREIFGQHTYIRQIRTTGDIDLAIVLSKCEEYEELINYLVKQENFSTTGNRFRVLFQQRIPVDIIPFGEIEHDENYSQWSNRDGFKPISTLGLSEAYQHSIPIIAEHDLQLTVTSLESIAILKLIAWNDRPEERKKDATDLAFILDNYFTIMDSLVYDEHFDLIDDDFDEQICAARLLGRLIKPILKGSEVLENQVFNIITTQIKQDVSSLAVAMIDEKNEYEKRLQMLKAIHSELIINNL
jgi:predicted nucleotidyltransferase